MIRITLLEARNSGDLYHSTSVRSANHIIKSNKLISQESTSGDEEFRDGESAVSFSRNKRTIYGPIQFVIDSDKLSDRYKLVPVVRGSEINDPTYGGEETWSQEERIVGRDVHNFLSYVKMVDMPDKTKNKIIRKVLFQSSKEDIINDKLRVPAKGFYEFYKLVKKYNISTSVAVANLFTELEYYLGIR